MAAALALNITLVGDRQVVANLRRLGPEVLSALIPMVEKLTLRLQRHVVADKLTGQVLNVRSGALRRSIQQKVEATQVAVFGRVFSAGDVKYAAIHEFGGRTPPHDIYPTKARALAFAIGGKTIFASVVHHPGSQMPERSFMRSSLADQRESITAGLKSAVAEGVARAEGRTAP